MTNHVHLLLTPAKDSSPGALMKRLGRVMGRGQACIIALFGVIKSIARKPRIHIPGGIYHVLLRGNGGDDIFFNKEDRTKFFLLLQQYKFR